MLSWVRLDEADRRENCTDQHGDLAETIPFSRNFPAG